MNMATVLLETPVSSSMSEGTIKLGLSWIKSGKKRWQGSRGNLMESLEVEGEAIMRLSHRGQKTQRRLMGSQSSVGSVLSL
jgi:hypothetical protein